MALPITEDDVRRALAGLTVAGRSLSEPGRLSAISVEPGRVSVAIAIEAKEAAAFEPLRKDRKSVV